ncbi:IclR family transcriptional regulator [Castellaniella sp. WN]
MEIKIPFFKIIDGVGMENNQGNSVGDKPFDRLLNVLEVVAHAEQALTLSEIALACDLPVATVHRLVAQLEERRLLKRLPGSKKLLVGLALVQLGGAAVQSALRSDLQHQILFSLATRIGEHCQIGQRVGNEIVYMDAASSVRSVGLRFEPGKRSPMHCASIGKLFLAEMSDTQLEWWLSHTERTVETPNTIVDSRKLRHVVEQVRRDQWAMSNEEVIPGVVGCAVPIRDGRGRLLAGLGIAVPTARVPYGQLVQFRAPMEVAAREISEALFLSGQE